MAYNFPFNVAAAIPPGEVPPICENIAVEPALFGEVRDGDVILIYLLYIF